MGRGALVGVASVLGTAIVSAIAAAIITPNTLQAFLPGDRGAPEARPSPTPVTYKRVSNRTGALTIEVPADWGAGDSSYRDLKGRLLGPGITAAVDPALPANSYTNPRAFLGASTVQARELTSAAGASGLQAELTRLVRSLDWTLDGCVFEREATLRRADGLVGPYRVWHDCAHTKGIFYDGYAAAPDGSYLVAFQIQFPDKGSGKVAEHILTSFRVQPERLTTSGR